MKLILILIFVSQSFSLDIFEQYIKQNGDSTLNGSLTITDDFTVTQDMFVDGNTLVVESSTDSVGIGTGTPTNSKLHILGGASGNVIVKSEFISSAGVGIFRIQDPEGGQVDFKSYGKDVFIPSLRKTGAIQSSGDFVFIIGPSVDRGRITSGGRLVMGATSTAYGIEAANGAVAGNGAYVNTSDKRLKENQEALTGACALVDQLTPLLYDWKSVVPSSYRTWANGFQFYDEDGNLQDGENQVNKQKHGLKDVGFFAQDVETVFPQAVSTTSKGRYNLQYEKFIPLLVACIQEMRR